MSARPRTGARTGACEGVRYGAQARGAAGQDRLPRAWCGSRTGSCDDGTAVCDCPRGPLRGSCRDRTKVSYGGWCSGPAGSARGGVRHAAPACLCLRLQRNARCLLRTARLDRHAVLDVHHGVRHEAAHGVVPDQVPEPGAR